MHATTAQHLLSLGTPHLSICMLCVVGAGLHGMEHAECTQCRCCTVDKHAGSACAVETTSLR
jgi:hypothetical protein